jgi:hypothetical protein
MIIQSRSPASGPLVYEDLPGDHTSFSGRIHQTWQYLKRCSIDTTRDLDPTDVAQSRESFKL